MLDELLGQEERAFQIGVEHAVVVGLGDIRESRPHFDPGVVDQDIEAAGRRLARHGLHGLVDDGDGLRHVSDVASHHMGLAAGRAHAVRGFVGAGIVLVHRNNDVRALLCQA